ncbi:methyltransferase family protein [Cryptosporangium arvum]|uniref:methyltransferase family protein n=1 Tax=Cryptosporangium arvum TaxID=80871 RepID=UPI0004BB2165|nr:methyltransferase dimerization domain-containing protein [Cryptosporangium arvum]
MTGPAPVWDVINGYAAYWALHAAVELGLFEQLPATSAELAAATGVHDPADVELLAQLLAAKGLLETDGERWTNSAAAERFLVATSPASMVGLVKHSPGPKQAWPALAGTLRTGHPAEPITDALTALYPALVAATAATQGAVARGVASELRTRGLWDGTGLVVDLGCGSGAWLDGLVGDDATGIGVDLPHVLPAPRERTTLIGGDYLDVDLPTGEASVVVLAHVLRAESDARAEALYRRAVDLLTDDGVLLVADYFRPPNGEKTEAYADAVHDLTLALTMRASTPGRGLTEQTLAAWGAHTVAVVEPVPRQRVHLIKRGTE